MLMLKRKNFVIISVFLVTILAFVFCFGVLAIRPTVEIPNKIRIVLDAGHGGIDGGVSGVNTLVKESDLNLIIVKKIEKYLISSGFSVVLTRSSDAGLYGIATKNRKKKDMQRRSEIINKVKPSLVVSVHMNQYSLSTRRGAQVFYKKSDESGKKLANCIQNSFNNMENSSRECSALVGDYYILNCSQYPSIIAECGFLSNPEDEALLITEEYQEEIAYAIFKGIVEYLVSPTFNYNY